MRLAKKASVEQAVVGGGRVVLVVVLVLMVEVVGAGFQGLLTGLTLCSGQASTR